METPDDTPPRRTGFTLGGVAYTHIDMAGRYGPDFLRLPVVLRLLLENALRNMRGAERDAAVAALFAWLARGTSEAEIAFQPGRVLMHDTTSTPALVDIAAMRDALDEAGMDPRALNPVLPVDVSVDHSLAVQAYAQADAAAHNLALELRRNAERYRFLRWASQALSNVRIHPPGTGIMHTINLEQLATVVCEQDGMLHPDMMIGTDSHTPMINGIGVLGWGVGGLEAQTVMFGMPTMLRIPDVIGVRLSGALPAGITATDLALTVTQRLRAIGVSGEFVEFFGPGVATLSAGSRCVVANMAPEYGATTGYFPIDGNTLDYLRQTGRDAAQVARVGAYAASAGLALDPAATPRYTRVVEIALDQVGTRVAGPTRPQDLHPYEHTRALLAAQAFSPATASPLPRHAIAIAAITSCTNTSDPRLLVAAGLLARKARRAGLKALAWVKTSLGPGSPAAADYLARAGLLDDLEAVGFGIVGYGCTTCIGNAGLAAGGARGHGSRRRPAGGGAVRQPQFHRPHPPGPGPGLPDVAASGHCLRAGRRRRARPGERAGAGRARWARGVPARSLARRPRDRRGAGARRARRRFPAGVPGGQRQSGLAGPAVARHALFSLGPGLDRAAPAALCRRRPGKPAGPLRRAPVAGAGRRRHHRPPLARQRHSTRQPGRRLPGGPRR